MRIFLSYAASDAPVARQLAAALSGKGHDPWLADDLPSGSNIALETGRALEQSDAMVVLVSPNAIKSSNVQHEIDFALGSEQFEDRLIPVVLRPTEDIPWIFRRLHPIRVDKDLKRTAAQIERALRTNKVKN